MKKIIIFSSVVLFNLGLFKSYAQSPEPVWVNPGVSSKTISIPLNRAVFEFSYNEGDTDLEGSFQMGPFGLINTAKITRNKVRYYATNNYTSCAVTSTNGDGSYIETITENVNGDLPFTEDAKVLTNIDKSLFLGPKNWLSDFSADGNFTAADMKEFWNTAGTFDPIDWPSTPFDLPYVEPQTLSAEENVNLYTFDVGHHLGGACIGSNTTAWYYRHFNPEKVKVTTFPLSWDFSVTLTNDNPSLYIGELLRPQRTQGEVEEILKSAILDYFVGSGYGGYGWDNNVPGFGGANLRPLPTQPETYYGPVSEAYTMKTRELTYSCSSQAFDKDLAADADGLDDDFRSWMLSNVSDLNDRAAFAAYSDLACTNQLPESDQPLITPLGDMLRFTNVIAETGTFYLKFENGAEDIIYKVEATGGTEPEIAALPELIHQNAIYSNQQLYPRVKAVGYEPGTYFFRTDEVKKYNESTGTWPVFYSYINTLDNGEEFPKFSSATLPTSAFPEGLYSYSYSAKSCTNELIEVDTKYFLSPLVEALVVNPEITDIQDPGREVKIATDNSTFNVSSADVKKIHFYTSKDITQVNSNVNLQSGLVRQIAGHHIARVERAIPAGINANQMFDVPWLVSTNGNMVEVEYEQLYKYEINIEDLPFNSPSFQFHFGTNQTYNINFIDYTGPSNIEASAIDEIIDHLTLSINYLKDAEVFGQNPSEPAVAQKVIFDTDEEKESGFATVDLRDLDLSRTEVNRLKPEDITVTATPVSGGTAITDVRIVYDHSYTNYLKLEFKTEGFTGPYTHAFVKLTYPSEAVVLNTPGAVDKPVVLNDLFFNHTLVGQAVQVNSNQPLIVQPGLRLESGSTLIVKETTNDILFEGLEYFENRNWIRSVARDDYGQIRVDSKQYFDDFGELEQIQVKEFDHHLVLATEVIKDEFGRSVGQTLAAPVRYGHHEVAPELLASSSYDDETMQVIPGYATFFEYAPNFVDRDQLNRKAFEGNKQFNPDAYVDNRAPIVDGETGSSLQEGHLGWYYSPSNAGSTHPLGEDHVPQTTYPYARIIYYDDPSGETFTQVPAGDYVWKDPNTQSRDDENTITYQDYNYLQHQEDNPNTSFDESQLTTVNPNYSDGTFSSGSNTPIMSALGQREPINNGTDQVIISKYLQTRDAIYLNDDLNEQLPVDGASFNYNKNGYKRRAFDYKGNESITYFDANDNLIITQQKFIEPLDLGGSTASEVTAFKIYDNNGRLHMSFTPKGTADLISGSETYASAEKTTYDYNRLGWLVRMTEPDAGTTNYIYRRDGLIRFSQDAQQAVDGRFSYTNYDYLNRPIESGEATYAAISGMTSFGDQSMKNLVENRQDQYSSSSSPANRFDINRTYYDIEYTHFVDEVLEQGSPVQKLYVNGTLMPDLTDVELAVPIDYQQSFLGGAVSWSETLPDNNSASESRAVYGYDERGRLSWLAQYIPELGVKIIRYTYGPMNNVVEVAYQPGQDDGFYHTYEYNLNGNLARAYASDEPLLNYRYLEIDSWKKEQYMHDHMIAAYAYYKHGPLKSVKLGRKVSEGSPVEGDEIYLQQLDYIYTINGALKSINNIHDASQAGALDDVFAMQLQYFNGDYLHATDGLTVYAKGTGAGGTQTTDLSNLNLETDYTGNIKAMLWAHKNDVVNTFGTGAESFMYDYDEAGQLSLAVFGTLNGGAIDHAGSFGVRNLAYDLNGNIQTLTREDQVGAVLSQTVGGQSLTHDLSYEYNATGPNQLSRVAMPGNIAYQSNTYNNIGQLTNQTQLNSNYAMEYDVSGQMTQFSNTTAGTVNTNSYNVLGFRDRKIDQSGGNTKTAYFVRDANGQTMAIYEKPTTNGTISLKEISLYGAGRVGVRKPNGPDWENTYEVKDHLGNVRGLISELETSSTPSQVTITPLGSTGMNDVKWIASACDKVVVSREPDKVIDSQGLYRRYVYYYWQDDYFGESMDADDINFEITADGTYYLRQYQINTLIATGEEISRAWAATLRMKVTVTIGNCDDHNIALEQSMDYYPYGMSLPNSTTNSYRYGYQGEFSEKDEETGWNHFELRDYDATIGRWMNPDPYRQHASPYLGLGNNPVYNIDRDGGWCYNADGQWITCPEGFDKFNSDDHDRTFLVNLDFEHKLELTFVDKTVIVYYHVEDFVSNAEIEMYGSVGLQAGINVNDYVKASVNVISVDIAEYYSEEGKADRLLGWTVDENDKWKLNYDGWKLRNDFGLAAGSVKWGVGQSQIVGGEVASKDYEKHMDVHIPGMKFRKKAGEPVTGNNEFSFSAALFLKGSIKIKW